MQKRLARLAQKRAFMKLAGDKTLGPIEFRVLELLNQGYGDRQIAETLGLSPMRLMIIKRRLTGKLSDPGPYLPDDDPPAAAMAARPFHYTRTDAVSRHPQVPSRRPVGGKVIPLWPDQH